MRKTPMLPSLEVTCHPGRTVARVTGCDALDECGTPAVFERLSALPPVPAGEALVLDLAAVRYTTSTGLGALISLSLQVRSAGGRLLLANTSEAVREALAVTRLDTLIGSLPEGEDGPAAGCPQPA